MSVKIEPYDSESVKMFEREAKRIRSVLGGDVAIEHVGCSAALIGGKNIVDILVGVEDFPVGLSAGMKLLRRGCCDFGIICGQIVVWCLNMKR